MFVCYVEMVGDNVNYWLKIKSKKYETFKFSTHLMRNSINVKVSFLTVRLMPEI